MDPQWNLVVLCLQACMALALAQIPDCCMPSQLSGRIFSIETRTRRTFAIDFDRGLELKVDDGCDNNYVIDDMKNNRRYSFNQGKCTFTVDPSIQAIEQCFHGNTSVGVHPFGFPGDGTYLKSYRINVGSIPVWKTAREINFHCYPFTTQRIRGNTKTTLLFHDIIDTLGNNVVKLGTPLDSCVEA